MSLTAYLDVETYEFGFSPFGGTPIRECSVNSSRGEMIELSEDEFLFTCLRNEDQENDHE